MTIQVIKSSLSILYKAIELLFPRVFTHTTYVVSLQKINHIHTYADVLYWLQYQEDKTKKLIWKFKYFLDTEALRVCTYILYDQLVADVSDRVNRIPFSTQHIVLHYPSSTYFKGKKQFDHMKELILSMDALQNIHEPFFLCCTHAILPNQNQIDVLKSQHAGSRRQRIEWSKKRFVLSPQFDEFMQKPENWQNHYSIHNPITNHTSRISHIYCIDDIVTTGASMKSVSDMLQEKYGVKVSKFCICH